MDIDSTFTVAARIDDVWETVMDFESVTGCIPGAEVLNKLNDDAYQIGMKVKLGPVSLQYRGQLNVLERDAASHRAVLQGTAKETRGQGTAQATVVLQLEEAGDGTQGLVSADVALSGKAAAMGKGVIGSVTEQLMGVFAANLQDLINDSHAGQDTADFPAHLAAVPEPTPGAAQTPTPGGPHTGGYDEAAAPASGPAPAGPARSPEEPPRPIPLAPRMARPVPASRSSRDGGPAGLRPGQGSDGLDGLALARGMVGEQLRHPAVQLWLYTAVAVVAYQLGRRAARYGS
ncbi:SRPBCC family protein [Arthrobacter sp. zg-ZUI100]|uniref:SRPBCC family protein n=1 Tax=Arthrobacter jiangjiafuii TaxID=2817475 RepID=UPI001AEE199E|nr:SRPBCC family protein [Arthrobacter jiangjiafuii]MBP3036706.1 SRPBCC family protein [Arthrobacter jiangjiafuii]